MRQRKTNLTVGRGRLYFDPFLPGTTQGRGERYLGNTPGFSITRTLEFSDKKVSRRGRIELGERQIIGETVSASITTDDMSGENVGLWMGLEPIDRIVEPQLFGKTVAVNRGDVISFGTTPGAADSLGAIRELTASRGGVPLDLATNFELSRLPFGQIEVRRDAKTIIDGDIISVYALSDDAQFSIFTETREQVRGALHYVSNNSSGDNYEYLFPYVHLIPGGSLDTKTDGFQSLTFDVMVRRLTNLTPYYHVKQHISFGAKTKDEKAIRAIPMSLVAFQLFEDRLNTVTQKTLPARGY